MKASDITPMPQCVTCKEPMVFTPSNWKLGQAKNVQCVNPDCPPAPKMPDHIQRERDRNQAKRGLQ